MSTCFWVLCIAVCTAPILRAGSVEILHPDNPRFSGHLRALVPQKFIDKMKPLVHQGVIVVNNSGKEVVGFGLVSEPSGQRPQFTLNEDTSIPPGKVVFLHPRLGLSGEETPELFETLPINNLLLPQAPGETKFDWLAFADGEFEGPDRSEGLRRMTARTSQPSALAGAFLATNGDEQALALLRAENDKQDVSRLKDPEAFAYREAAILLLTVALNGSTDEAQSGPGNLLGAREIARTWVSQNRINFRKKGGNNR